MASYRVKRSSIPKQKLLKSTYDVVPTTDDLPSLRRKRTLAFNRVKTMHDVALQAKSSHSEEDLDLFLAHHSALSKYVDNFEDAHSAILTLLGDAHEDDEDSYRVSFDQLYFKVITMHRQLTRRADADALDPESDPTYRINHSSSVKLPKIEIPKFSGNIKTWPEYYDVFNSLIHENTSLCNTEKMHYLVSTLTGDALGLIRTFPAQGVYYEEAYRTLVSRYRNKRELAFTCWKEMQSLNIKANTPLEFRRVLDTFNENLTILKGLDLPTEHWDFVLCYLLLSKLDSKTRCEFEQAHPTVELPCYRTLKDFLYSKCEALVRDTHFSSQSRSNSDKSRPSNDRKFSVGQKNTTSVFLSNTSSDQHVIKKPYVKQSKLQAKSSTTVTTPSVSASQSTVKQKCVYCSSDHSIIHCAAFANLPIFKRADYAKVHHWCFNCLKSSHHSKDCKSIFRCRKCHHRHHTLLHNDDERSSEDVPSNEVESPVRALTSIGDSSVVLLSTAIIRVKDSAGQSHSLRALIDCGSQAHFITERAAYRLGLDCLPSARNISGLGQSSASASGVVNLEIVINDKVAFNINALTLPNICGYVPHVRLNRSSWHHLRHLHLADPSCHQPGPIDVLLGVEIFSSLLLPGKVSGDPNQPSALNTVFGWILMGKVGSQNDDGKINSFMITNEQLYDEVKMLWELESIPKSSRLSLEEQKCEDIFSSQHSRDESGRFTVVLPFKEEGKENLTFPGSRDIALRRYYALERKLDKNAALREQYCDFMADYLHSGHMSLVTLSDLSHGRYYIPHHCVLRPDSVTTKLRVVFDASARDLTGKSLNETLLIGPKLQTNILEILLRFRTHPVVFTADVRQMYRQILVREEDRDFQRIFWRFDSSQPVQEYRLNTVTYGVSSAPFLACRAIRQLTIDEHDLPLARAIVNTDMYIDDIVTGCSDLHQASIAKNEITDLLSRGQMELRKWASNRPELLSDLPPEHCLTNSVSLDIEKSTLKVLGLTWDPKSDVFSFDVKPQPRRCTRRNILSELARIFDPLGFLSPITLSSKILVQKLWILNVSWDEEPPMDIVKRWELIFEQLPIVKHLKIPRCLAAPLPTSCQLHGFADSSEAGYGAVIYLRSVRADAGIQVSLVAAKSRVAPTKKISLPRLELCAAVLLAELLKIVKESYSLLLPIHDIHAWSDSTVTLAWIRSSSSRWKTFVANRVSLIQDSIPGTSWHHVPSNDNPADVASRGSLPADLIHNSLWWAGPSWLADSIDQWPNGVTEVQLDAVREEERIQSLVVHEEFHFIDHLLDRYSSLPKVQRIVCYLIRFSLYIRSACRDSVKSLHQNPLSRVELHHSLLIIVLRTQALYFTTEIAQLKGGQVVSKHLRKLSPFLDDRGVLRVGGRLSRSGLEFDHKHPALLPSKSRLTSMIIEEMHSAHGHPGVNTLLYLLNQQFWILSSKRAIRRCLSKCFKCYRLKPVPLEPYMSDLPRVRVNQAKPFSIVGVDYGGPFRIKFGPYRGAKLGKAYLCLFVCFTTKAVHLETVSDLSTDAFIAALRRFVGRRGRVSTIYSDCGTNFVGAHNQITSYMQSAATQTHIEFKFNPPSSPHFGGVWEIQIKAVKTHLYRIVGTQTLTFEELSTLFVQIESMLNSRPLYPISSDPNDLTVLTPGHFLTLEPLTSVPDEDLSSLNINRLSRWQLIQRFQRDFWKRWKNEYLHSLSQRAKWTSKEKPLDIGSVVILKTDSTVPLHWPLARVHELHSSPDGVVRIATVRLANGTYLTRPLVKLCPLPNLSD